MGTLIIDDNDTATTVSVRRNCSVYNPCGRNGHCRDTKQNEWECSCKFWWNGTLCDEMTDSGKQVIALGVLTGVLMAIFYGLLIFYTVKRKRKQPKSTGNRVEDSRTSTRRLPTIPMSMLNPSRRYLSWITGIGTLILTVVALLTKWALIKPIHEGIVEKFETGQPLFFHTHSVCGIIDLKPQFNLFTFPFACLLILIFIVITKRVAFQRGKGCYGYFGIPVPLDHFAHVKRTLAAMIFAVFADELLDIAMSIFSRDPSMEGKGVIVRYLLQLLKVLIIGLRRFPILAAVYIDNHLSLICASLYVWLDFSVAIVHSSLCVNEFYKTEKTYGYSDTGTIADFEYYGTGSKMLFIQLFSDIPRYFCLAYISIKLPVLLIKHIRHPTGKKFTREQKFLLYSSLPNSAEARYVKKLLGMDRPEPPRNCLSRFARRIYAWRDDFRFSSRVVCLYAAIFLLLFFVTSKVLFETLPYLQSFEDDLQKGLDFLALGVAAFSDDNGERSKALSDFPVPHLTRPFIFGILIAALAIVFQLLVMLANIRRNLLQAFRGDDTEIPRRMQSRNISYVSGNIHFAGYLIGYVILASFLMAILSLIITVSVDSFITYGSVRLLEKVLKGILPSILFMLFKMYLNKLLGTYAFLQYEGRVLSVNNRRVFMVFIYFNIFLDAFLGLLAAIIRIIKSIAGGIVYMCRLDYSPLGRKLELMDAGFNAYCGFIYMECAHRHPVLLCFCSHLLRDHLYKAPKLSKAKHQWHLAVFLLNNPTLIYRRKDFLARVKINEAKLMLIGRKNVKDMYIEQPPILAHRASIISEKELQDAWERRRF